MKHILNTEPEGYEQKEYYDVKNHRTYYEFFAKH